MSDVLARVRRLSLTFPLAVYGASRILTYVAARLGGFLAPGLDLTHFFGAWDATWYLKITQVGYPNSIPTGAGGRAVHSQIPFFPLYPLLVRAVDRVSPVSTEATAVLAALLLGAVAVAALWAVTVARWDVETARRVVTLFCFLPGSFVLSFAYSEGVMIALSIGCLAALERQRWWWAGVLGALATASRPNAIVLVVCAAWAAVVAIRTRREWRALVAPALVPLGAVAFFAYLWKHTGEMDAWFRVQREAWGEHPDYGASVLHELRVIVTHPLTDVNDTIVGFTIVMTVVMVWFLVRARLPAIYNIFTAGTLLFAYTSAVLLPRPRFVFVAFPLTMAAGRCLTRERFGLAVAVAAAAMTLLTLWYGYSWGRLIGVLPP